MDEGAAAEQALAEAGRATASRRELARHDGFEQVSPEVGVLDEGAFDRQMADDPDEALALLADLTGATDVRLRELARRLAGRVVVDVARRGPARRRGPGRLRHVPADRSLGDLDLDQALEPLALARSRGEVPALDELRSREWGRPRLALCLVVDRSGSMGGERLATAAVAAATCLWRAPDDAGVVAFSDRAVVVASQGGERPAESVVEDLFRLRGHGTTDLALALRTAAGQLSRSAATRKVAVVLSDCRATTGDDPAAAAAGLDEVVVVAPADDPADAGAFAGAIGARWVTVAGPADVPRALAEALSG